MSAGPKGPLVGDALDLLGLLDGVAASQLSRTGDLMQLRLTELKLAWHDLSDAQAVEVLCAALADAMRLLV